MHEDGNPVLFSLTVWVFSPLMLIGGMLIIFVNMISYREISDLRLDCQGV